MNKFFIKGYLGGDAEIHQTENSRFATFSVAYTKRFKKNEQIVEKTMWFRCLAGKQFEKIFTYLKRGKHLLIVGEINVNIVEQKTYYEVICNEIHFLDKKSISHQENENDLSINPEEIN